MERQYIQVISDKAEEAGRVALGKIPVRYLKNFLIWLQSRELGRAVEASTSPDYMSLLRYQGHISESQDLGGIIAGRIEAALAEEQQGDDDE